MNDLLQQIQNFAGDFTHVEPVYYRNGNIVRRSRSGQETIIPLGGTFVETDPTVPGHVKAITTTQVNNWNTAYSWGNHASAGYLTTVPTLQQVTTVGAVTTNTIQAFQLISTFYSIAGTFWSGSGYRNNNNGNMSYSWSGSNMVINTDAGSSLWIYNTGNVGVGTTADAGYKFNVAGSLRVTAGEYAATSGLFVNTQGEVVVGGTTPAGGGRVFTVNGIASFMSVAEFYNEIRLGQATGDESATYTIKSGGAISINANVQSSNATFDTLSLTSGVSNASSIVILGNFSNGRITFNVFGTESMRITKDGNVLIAKTTDEGFKLDVTGTIRSSSIIYATGGNSTNWNTAFGWGNHASAGYLTSQPWTISGSNLSYNSGNVMVGTATDNGYKFQVNGTLSAGVSAVGVFGGDAADTQSSNRGLTVRGDLVVGHTGNFLSKLTFGYINSTKYVEIGTDGTGPYFYGTTVLPIRFITFTGGLYVTTDYYGYFTNNLAVGGNANAGSRTLVVNGTLGSTGAMSVGTLTTPVRFQVGAKVIDDNGFTYDANTAMVVHQTGTSSTALNDPKEVLVLARQGTAGQAFGAGAAFEISRYENSGTASKTRLDIKLADGSFLGFSTRVMTMLSNGNVGLGTTSPLARLHTEGDILVKNSNSFPRVMIRGNYPGLIFSSDDNTMQFGSITTVQEYGTNPYGNLAITSRTGLYIYIQSFSSSIPAMSFLGGNVQVGNNADAGYKFDVAGSLRSTGSAYFATTSGRVGIGTTNPASKLDVNGTIYANSVAGNTTGYNIPNLVLIQTTDTNWAYGAYSDDINQYWMQIKFAGNNTNNRGFRILDCNPNIVRFVLNSIGNVGIGTTSPASKLDVDGTISVSGLPFVFGAPGSSLNVITRPDGQHAFYIASGGDAHTAYQNLEHRFRDMNGNNRLAIRSSGNVIVGGYTDEGFKFQVNGTTKITGSVTLSNLPTGIVKSTNGALSAITNGLTGTITIQQPSGNPPINIDVVDGLIVNVSGAMIMV